MKISFLSRLGILMMTVFGSPVVATELPHGLVDPTRPLGGVATRRITQSDLILTSVMITETKRVAVINGENISEGQEIGGAEVVSIQPGRVILLRGDRSEELKVHQSDVKHSADQQSNKKLRL